MGHMLKQRAGREEEGILRTVRKVCKVIGMWETKFGVTETE